MALAARVRRTKGVMVRSNRVSVNPGDDMVNNTLLLSLWS